MMRTVTDLADAVSIGNPARRPGRLAFSPDNSGFRGEHQKHRIARRVSERRQWRDH